MTLLERRACQPTIYGPGKERDEIWQNRGVAAHTMNSKLRSDVQGHGDDFQLCSGVHISVIINLQDDFGGKGFSVLIL